MIAAAKAANIHNFVTALPAGYETNVNRIIIKRMLLISDNDDADYFVGKVKGGK